MYMIVITILALVSFFAALGDFYSVRLPIVPVYKQATDKGATRTAQHEHELEMDRASAVNTSGDWYYSGLASALKPANRRISLVVNSCGRLDLLNRTISSFMRFYPHSSYPLFEKLIIDDCRRKEDAQQLVAAYMPEFELMFTEDSRFDQASSKRFSTHTQLSNKKRSKELKHYRIMTAMDKTHAQIKTEWIYHLEDDWEFSDYGFVDDAFNVFEHALHQKQSSAADAFKYSIAVCRSMGPKWLKQVRGGDGRNATAYMMHYVDQWGGFTFNAGMYPTFIYDRYRPFAANGPESVVNEGELSLLMKADEMHVALQHPPKCTHIGGERTVSPKLDK